MLPNNMVFAEKKINLKNFDSMKEYNTKDKSIIMNTFVTNNALLNEKKWIIITTTILAF